MACISDVDWDLQWIVCTNDIKVCMNRPITWENDRNTLIIITVIVLAIIAFGAICYHYVGGRFEDIPGYNQGYAYFMWTVAGAITLGTAAVYLAKYIKSLNNQRST